MPTFDKMPRFLRDWSLLTPAQQKQFMRAVANLVHDLRLRQGFGPGLRVKGVRGHANVFEMTWAQDGRATFEYGTSPLPGDAHIIWRRIGGHGILREP